MHIALETSSLNSGHTHRGIGEYTRLLSDAFKKYAPEHTIETEGHRSTSVQLIHYPTVDLFGPIFRHTSPIPFVATIHDVIPLKFRESFPTGIRATFRSRFTMHYLRKARAILTDSHCSKQDIQRHLTIPKKNIHVVYLAPKPIITVDKKPTYDFILYVGDVNWNKNVLGLIDAFNIVQKKYPELKLVLVGNAFTKDIPEAHEITNTIRNYGLDDKVVVTGRVTEKKLATLYATAKIYVQPSWYEGFGFPVLEAMQYGTPTVVAKTGSLSEVGGSAAMYFDPASQQSFVTTLTHAMRLTPRERAQISRTSKAHARTFSWKKTVERTLEVYQNVLNEST